MSEEETAQSINSDIESYESSEQEVQPTKALDENFKESQETASTGQSDDPLFSDIPPGLHLTYEGEAYAAFSHLPPNGLDHPVLEEPIFGEDPDVANSLYYGPLSEVMVALKTFFDIANDVVLDFPYLKLRFHEHSKYAEIVSIDSLGIFHTALYQSQGIPHDQWEPLKMELFQESGCFIQRYMHLKNMTLKGGKENDPIVLEDDSEVEHEGKTITEQTLHHHKTGESSSPPPYEEESAAAEPKRSREVEENPDMEEETHNKKVHI